MGVGKNLFLVFLIYHVLLLKVDSECPKSFRCGQLGQLEFPFTKDLECGLFLIEDCDHESPKRVQLEAGGHWYDVRRAIRTNKLLLSDSWPYESLIQEKICFDFTNLPLPPSISFTFSPHPTLFRCCSNQTSDKEIQDYFQDYHRVNCSSRTHPSSPPPYTVYYRNQTTHVPPINQSGIPKNCSVIQLPVKSNQGPGDELPPLSADEFALEGNVSEACYQCYHGGQCLPDHMKKIYCERGNKRFKIIFLAGGVVTAFICTSIVVLLFIRKRHTILKLLRHQNESANEKDIQLFLRNNGNLAPRRYKYSEVKRMTNSFSENLGKGGYGSVYKGTLADGHLVAVKILNETKGNGEEFMNEVASISRTSHVNIVTLLEFCFEGSKRALVYEFMLNGSLEKFIPNTASSPVEGGLGWQKLFEIALGIARGLEYLHQGCRTRILHFDIKPHNILLDKDLNPKISDFGLAKLCPNRSSIVSMLVARGTIGYIAPEVFCSNFGEVSHKSDVYSYGMMVLEIAGGRKNIDRRDVDHTSEIYFPHYIYNQLEMDAETDGTSTGVMNEDENQFAKKKLLIVGLWCIQIDPKDRPSMTKVVEMLEGKLESLQVPPKPYLSSPPRSAPNFSISEST